jgi:hypothetical protein
MAGQRSRRQEDLTGFLALLWRDHGAGRRGTTGARLQVTVGENHGTAGATDANLGEPKTSK